MFDKYIIIAKFKEGDEYYKDIYEFSPNLKEAKIMDFKEAYFICKDLGLEEYIEIWKINIDLSFTIDKKVLNKEEIIKEYESNNCWK